MEPTARAETTDRASSPSATDAVPKGTRALGWIGVVSGVVFAYVVLGDVRDAGAMYRGATLALFLLSHGFALVAAPRRAWLVVDAAILAAWGGIHLLLGAGELLSDPKGGGPIAGMLFRGLLSTAFGVAIVRSEPIARSWAWPLLSLLQPGINAPAGNLLLLAIAAGVTRYIRHRPEFRRTNR